MQIPTAFHRPRFLKLLGLRLGLRLGLWLGLTLAACLPANASAAKTKRIDNPDSEGLGRDLAVREEMLKWSRQLGVTCNHCHNMANLRDSSKATFQTAKAHSQMVEGLNQQKISGLPQVNCFLCHRGSAHIAALDEVASGGKDRGADHGASKGGGAKQNGLNSSAAAHPQSPEKPHPKKP